MEGQLHFVNTLAEFDFSFLSSYSKVAILTDTNTVKHCYPLVKEILPEHTLITVPSGEEHKNLDTCESIWQALTDNTFDRKSVMINLGGGVIGDMGGFCASTFKRGIDFFQIPTTVLAQVDASVGGKLGVDFGHFKNHIGLFQMPQQVLICTELLNTLPKRELRSGFAEIIKHALIADVNHWRELLKIKNLEEIDWLETIRHSVHIKETTATNDPYEKGLRKILNFGHTIGHAIESSSLDAGKRLLHGEAIAIGMVAETYLSYLLGFITKDEASEVAFFILHFYEKVDLSAYDYEELFVKMKQDKKNEFDKVLFSLLDQLGTGNFNQECSREQVIESLEWYQYL